MLVTRLLGGSLLALVITVSGAGCAETGTSDQSTGSQPLPGTKLSVYVVNYPLAYFAERIGGSLVDVQFPAPGDQDSAFWSPEAEVIARFQEADIILLNGASYAKWVDRVTLPASRLVNTSAGFKDQYIIMENAVAHTHGPGGEHEHGDIAFTTWLDFELAAQQAGAVFEAFNQARPEEMGRFQANYNALVADLEAVDQALITFSSQVADSPSLGSHLVYQYLARAYDLNLESVHFEPDEAPSARQLRELRDMLEDHPALWVLWEGEPMEETVASLEELGISSIVFDPCANAPESGDFLTVMRKNVENLGEIIALAKQK